MVEFGNFFGSLLGYVLWAFYAVFKNYGIAIILFTLLLKVAMFPFSIKQQKSMAANSKMAAKQNEIRVKYANDKVKMQEEMQKLYEKEGVNPMGGCLPMLIPFPIMIGLYYTVINPLSNALHLAKDAVSQSVAVLQQIPGIGSTFQSFYGEIEIVKHFDELKPFLTMFSAEELDRIGQLSSGFNFLGLDLLGTPASMNDGVFNAVLNMFQSNLWIIPVVCLVSSWATQILVTKLQPGMQQQQQQGCMKLMLYGMPLFTAYIALTVPAAVGFYWIISTLSQLLQTLILHKFYSPAHMTARTEAQRVALLELEEAKMEPLPEAEQKKLADKLLKDLKSLPQKTEKKPEQKKTQPGGKSKGKTSGGSSDYLGSKK